MRLFGTQRRWTISLAILGVGIAGSGLLIATGPAAVPVEREEKAWPVSTLAVNLQPLRPRFATFATVESSQVANLRAAVDAPISLVAVRAGDRVQANDVLIRLDDHEFVLAVRQREAQLSAAEADLDSLHVTRTRLAQEMTYQQRLSEIASEKLQRYDTLRTDGMVSESIHDEVRREASEQAIELARHQAELSDMPNREKRQRATIAQAQARLDDARIDLERTVIRAPFSGPVLAVNAAPGDQMRAVVLVSIADSASIELRAAIPARYTTRLREQLTIGQSITAFAAGNVKGATFSLRRLAGDIKPGQSGLDAWFAIPHGQIDHKQIGSVISIEVALPAVQAVVAVPVQSLFENDRMYVVDGDRLRGIDVERVGEYRDQKNNFSILVRSPELRSGDALITTQLPNAISGLLVTPLPSEGTALAGR